MIKELLATLRDWRECGDLWGHLQAWWIVVSRRVTLDCSVAEVVG